MCFDVATDYLDFDGNAVVDAEAATVCMKKKNHMHPVWSCACSFA